ncbi:MAG TPA: hypothetical protein VN915_04515 [Elusimicrobiota bacterium]|nr:hypothetical protein [Elusimicrobiota bacterium]
MFARLAASALLSLTAAFSAAQEIRVERVSFSAPVAGAAAAAPLGAPALSGGMTLAASPSLLAAPPRGAAPSAAAPAAAPEAAEARQVIQAASASAEAHLAIQAAAASSKAAMPAPTASATPKEALPMVESPLLSPAAETRAAPAAGAPAASEMDRDAADRQWAALLGERLVQGRGDVAAPAASTVENGSPSAAASARLSAPSRARWLSAAPAVAAAALPAAFRLSGAQWHVLSMGGYVAGNVGAAMFPLVQIYQALHGKSTPRSRAIIAAAASFALGLVCAPILHKWLWGVQNIFGGVTLLVPLAAGALKGTGMGPLKATALISAAALAVSAAIYFAAAAAVPALLGAMFSAAVISKVALVTQFATSAMFLWMFLPDVVKVLRGQAAGGFSPGFNLMFFLSALGCMIWAVPSAWIYSGADQNTYRLIFGVNSIYAAVSFASFWLARREAKPKA